MNKDIFLHKLEELLSDLPEAEKKEALEYYRSYFEDAGDENPEKVIEELGSPERISEIIHRDLSEGRKLDYESFTHAASSEGKKPLNKKLITGLFIGAGALALISAAYFISGPGNTPAESPSSVDASDMEPAAEKPKPEPEKDGPAADKPKPETEKDKASITPEKGPAADKKKPEPKADAPADKPKPDPKKDGPAADKAKPEPKKEDPAADKPTPKADGPKDGPADKLKEGPALDKPAPEPKAGGPKDGPAAEKPKPELKADGPEKGPAADKPEVGPAAAK